MAAGTRLGLLGAAALVFLAVAAFAPEPFLGHFMVFMLSVVIGFYVIGGVHHALHTPLMSVTNAISGIIVVGALLQVGHAGRIVGHGDRLHRHPRREHQRLRWLHRDRPNARDVPGE